MFVMSMKTVNDVTILLLNCKKFLLMQPVNNGIFYYEDVSVT